MNFRLMHVNQHSVKYSIGSPMNHQVNLLIFKIIIHRHNTSKWAKLQNLHTLTCHMVSWKAKVYVSLRVYWPLGCTGNLLHTSLRYLGSGLCFGKTHSKLKMQVAQDPCCMHAANTRKYVLVGVFVAIIKRNFTDYRILCMPTCTDGEPYSGAEKSTRSFTG